MLLLVKKFDGIIILLTLFCYLLNNIYSKAMWTIRITKWTNLLFINKTCTYIFVVNTTFVVLLLFRDI